MDRLLEELNESQRQAVEYCEGPSLVIAGAGSGKTRVLTYKIAYLLDVKKVKPWNILALTFTNKAAKEMKRRIAELVGLEKASKIQMGTFHSVFSRILRAEAEYIDYTPNYTIYDEADSRSLLKSIIKEMQLDEKVYKPSKISHLISMAKNHLILDSDYANHPELIERDKNSKMSLLGDIYRTYQDRCRKSNAMDFDDLLVNIYVLFKHNDEICQKYNDRFKYILIDEYQDTNVVQEKIILELYKYENKPIVCAVGDDAQSIYSFRGATIDNMLKFKEHFVDDYNLFGDNIPIFLVYNYRSTQNIVKAANSLLRKNQLKIAEKTDENTKAYSKDVGDLLIVKEAYSDREEASIVCNEIKKIVRRENVPYSDFAILYRTNAQSRAFEEELRKQAVPYRVYGGLSFYQRKEIKDIIAYFRMVVNPNDEEAFKRIINYPTRGIGATTITKISACAIRCGVSLWEVVTAPKQYGLDVNSGTFSKLAVFQELISSFIARFDTSDAYQLGTEIIKESGISGDLYADNSPEGTARQENLEEFLAGLQDFVETRREEDRANETSLRDYLQEVALLTDLDSDGNEDEQRKVVMMTVHSAKGLEFPTVFVVGLEENIFPSPMSTNSKRELEEERRLLYVAITRAEKHCYLTYAKSRWRFGHMEFSAPSRFIRDIDPTLIVTGDVEEAVPEQRYGRFGAESRRGGLPFSDGSRYQNARPVASQFRADPKPREVAHREELAQDPFSPAFKRTFAASGGNLRRVSSLINHKSDSPAGSASSIQEGNVIEHERFGIGTVIKLEGTGENQKATVDFRNLGSKQLLLKFARFKILE